MLRRATPRIKRSAPQSPFAPPRSRLRNRQISSWDVRLVHQPSSRTSSRLKNVTTDSTIIHRNICILDPSRRATSGSGSCSNGGIQPRLEDLRELGLRPRAKKRHPQPTIAHAVSPESIRGDKHRVVDSNPGGWLSKASSTFTKNANSPTHRRKNRNSADAISRAASTCDRISGTPAQKPSDRTPCKISCEKAIHGAAQRCCGLPIRLEQQAARGATLRPV